MYALARERRADRMFEELIGIADDSKGDAEVVDRKLLINHANVQRDRLRVDTRKFALAKLMPRKYGDHVEHQHTHDFQPAILIQVGAQEPASSVIDVEAQEVSDSDT